MSHLHFDHAGGLLLADGARAFPRARIVAQRAEWEIALERQPAARRLLRPAGAPPRPRLGRRGLGGRRARAAARRLGRAHGRPLGRPPGDRRPRRRARRPNLAFFGDLCMRPWSANPRWVTSFDDFPLDSVEVKGDAVRPGGRRGLDVVLSHEPVTPVGRLVRDRDRFRYEARLTRGRRSLIAALGAAASASAEPAGRTSTASPSQSRPGQSAAISARRFGPAHSTTMNPPRISLVSRNGPSLMPFFEPLAVRGRPTLRHR